MVDKELKGTPDPLSHVPTGPVPSSKQGSRLLDLVRVMARLRGPDGCPWDRAQTHASLRRHLLDEAYELLDAIDDGDPVRLKEELGDLLLQSVFHAQMAADAGTFDIDDVAESTVEKLIHRHPHVFADVEAETPEQVYGNWERIKSEEKGEHGIAEGIPKALPSLLAAQKVQRRAAGRGFDWAELAGAVAKVREELAELEEAARGHEADDREGAAKDALEEEVGDVLFSVTALARKLGVDAETSLRGAVAKFVRRYEGMEAEATREGVNLRELSEDELLRRFRSARR
ncbi:MAG TPA: nucleoside triphosphate pyrophosphohydrolase [Actinomycetota bacterium]|nr:nucleoside triphosphate pyrophosphohydrolase [Actinomycetota bacterium]